MGIRSTGGTTVNERAAEIIEAVKLLHSLGKPVELICSQLDLIPAEVVAIVSTGTIPKRQKSLFAETVKPQKKKPETRVASWVQALQK